MQTLRGRLRDSAEQVSTFSYKAAKCGDRPGIQYSTNSRSDASSLNGVHSSGTLIRDDVLTGAELDRLWYNSRSQLDVWTKLASEIGAVEA